MSQKILEDIFSSKARLRIADLISLRPRTLKELSDLTGISVQGVLKHLSKLEGMGLVTETKIPRSELPVRKLYSIKGVRVGDFSQAGLTVVKMTGYVEQAVLSDEPVKELESLAGDALIQRRRIRDQARRLGRAIDDLVSTEARISGLISGLNVEDEDRILLHAAFTEESLEEAEKALREHYGLKESRRAIEKAISRARKLGKK